MASKSQPLCSVARLCSCALTAWISSCNCCFWSRLWKTNKNNILFNQKRKKIYLDKYFKYNLNLAKEFITTIWKKKAKPFKVKKASLIKFNFNIYREPGTFIYIYIYHNKSVIGRNEIRDQRLKFILSLWCHCQTQYDF